MTTRLAWLVVLCAGACGRAASNPFPDGGEVDAGSGDDGQIATSCTSRLVANAAAGLALSGTGQFVEANGAWTRVMPLAAEIYFPTGRVPGGTVLLAMRDRSWGSSPMVSDEVVLADDLSATGLTLAGDGIRLTADLLPGTSGVRAEVWMNFASLSSDVVQAGTATVRFCPTGEVSAAPASDFILAVTPIEPLVIQSAVPLAASTVTALTVTAGDRSVPVVVQPVAGHSTISVTPVAAFPPMQPLTIDLSKVRDVLGRPVPSLTGIWAMGSAETLDAGLSLPMQADSPAMSCVGSCASGSGTITVGGGSDSGSYVNQAIIGLPAPMAATKLRVSATMTGPNADTNCDREGTVAVVDEMGARSDIIALTCSTAAIQYDIDLQALSPVRWLVVRAPGPGWPPFSPAPGPSTKVTIVGLQAL